ncbi:MAG: FmdB family zinc ribbon protein [Candidatus Binatia bacterium]
MPLYEYECSKCGQFEYAQRITDDPLSRCPSCRRRVTKLISSTSFRLKGGGWYAEGYQKSNGNSAGKSDSGSKKTASAKSATSDSATSDSATSDS